MTGAGIADLLVAAERMHGTAGSAAYVGQERPHSWSTTRPDPVASPVRPSIVARVNEDHGEYARVNEIDAERPLLAKDCGQDSGKNSPEPEPKCPTSDGEGTKPAATPAVIIDMTQSCGPVLGPAKEDDRKKKRKRLSDEQRAVLMSYFTHGVHFPTYEQRQALATQLGMTPRAVQVWFQNRRQGQKSLGRPVIKATGVGPPGMSPEIRRKMAIASPPLSCLSPVNPNLTSPVNMTSPGSINLTSPGSVHLTSPGSVHLTSPVSMTSPVHMTSPAIAHLSPASAHLTSPSNILPRPTSLDTSLNKYTPGSSGVGGSALGLGLMQTSGPGFGDRVDASFASNSLGISVAGRPSESAASQYAASPGLSRLSLLMQDTVQIANSRCDGNSCDSGTTTKCESANTHKSTCGDSCANSCSKSVMPIETAVFSCPFRDLCRRQDRKDAVTLPSFSSLMQSLGGSLKSSETPILSHLCLNLSDSPIMNKQR